MKNGTGCFYTQLNRHLGDGSDEAAAYATQVTGSIGDFFVIEPTGILAFYDGVVRENGEAYTRGQAPLFSVAEAKWGYGWLNKFIEKQKPGRDRRLIYNPNPPSLDPFDQKEAFNKMKAQVRREQLVAERCKLEYFMSFSNLSGFLSAQEIFQKFYRDYRYVPKPVTILRIEIDIP
jgi:hypothetical protein